MADLQIDGSIILKWILNFFTSDITISFVESERLYGATSGEITFWVVHDFNIILILYL